MSYYILNAAMVPNEGTFAYRVITRDEAREWLAGHIDQAESYIGYPQTQEHVRSLLPSVAQLHEIRLNRAKAHMEAGDEALVCRLTYRVEDPATKGQLQREDWEYGVLRCVAGGDLDAEIRSRQDWINAGDGHSLCAALLAAKANADCGVCTHTARECDAE